MPSDPATIAPTLSPALLALSERLRRRTLGERGSFAAPGASPPAEAAVLVPLVLSTPDQAPRLWLLKRPSTMRTHAGQMAFPGGRVDPQDADHVAAALREADEEIGLPPRAVQLLGPLDSLVTPTGFRIRPVVGLVPSGFEPHHNPAEVELTLQAPLAEFLRPPSGTAPYLGLHLGAHWVWGATFWIAKTLAELARDPLRLQPPSAPR